MSIFSPMVDTLFQGPMAQDAVYQKQGDDPVSVRVIPTQADVTDSFGGLDIIQKSTVLDVLKTSIPNPEEGDVLTFGETDYRIRHWICRDADRLIWTLYV